MSKKTLKYPFWLANIIKALLKSYSIEKLSNIKQQVADCIEIKRYSKEYQSERDYIDVFYLLGEIGKQENHKLKALSFELEADDIWDNRVINTFYPTLPDIYQKAYQEINEIKQCEPELAQRIKEKLINANKYFIEILSTVGLRYEIPFPEEEKIKIQKWIANEKWESSIDLLFFLINIPFASKENVAGYINVCTKASVISSMWGNNKLDNKGNTIGVDNAENSLRTEGHIYYRQKILFAIWSCLEKATSMNLHMEEEILFYMMRNNIPFFINDEDRLAFWFKGFIAGFNKDFMTASHILVPQVEYALRNIIEEYQGSLVKLEAEKQEEATLGTVLKSLENVFKDEIWFEIWSFLQSGIDVNFRNRLSHGLFSSFEITQSGVYLWWLSIKLFFNINDILGHKKEISNE